jgi:RTX calcium-binding nonapeptide repeat (4 copies)
MVVLALLLPTAAPALAGTARLETGQQGSATTARVVYRDAPTGRGVEIRLFRGNEYGGDRFKGAAVVGFEVSAAAAGVTPGPGCEVLFAHSVACPVPPGVLLRGPVVYAGDEADAITVVVPAPGTVIYGGPGSDALIAAPRGGPEGRFGVHMYGGPGDDQLEATGTLRGGTGDDSFDMTVEGSSRIFGGRGGDVIDASEHADTVVPGPGRDLVYSNGGADVIRSRDGVTDVIDCGEGRDVAVVDVFDTTDFKFTDRVFEECDRLRRRGEPRAIPTGFQSWEGEPDVYLWVGCPPDGPERCLGDATLYRQGRTIARSSLRMRAGEWDVVLFRLGPRRIRGLLGRRIRIVLRTIDRSGRFQKATLVDSLEKFEPEYDSARRTPATRTRPRSRPR